MTTCGCECTGAHRVGVWCTPFLEPILFAAGTANGRPRFVTPFELHDVMRSRRGSTPPPPPPPEGPGVPGGDTNPDSPVGEQGPSIPPSIPGDTGTPHIPGNTNPNGPIGGGFIGGGGITWH